MPTQASTAPLGAPVLQTRGLTIRFGGHVAVDEVSCVFHRSELTAIVGPNGAGKTTYFNLISGQLPASAGQVLFRGEDITALPAEARTLSGIGRAFQLTNLFPGLTVLENVRLAVQARARTGFKLFRRASQLRALTAQAEQYLERCALAARRAQLAAALSHGDQRKLEIAILLALEPEVFMFDEPTAGMSVDDVPVILDLIRGIKAQSDKTVLLVEHKLDVIRELADRIVVLHNGQKVADGDPVSVMRSPVVLEAYLGKEAAA